MKQKSAIIRNYKLYNTFLLMQWIRNKKLSNFFATPFFWLFLSRKLQLQGGIKNLQRVDQQKIVPFKSLMNCIMYKS